MKWPKRSKRPRSPPLYRLSRAFQLSTIVVVIILVAYIIFAGVSVLHITSSTVSGQDTVQPTLGNQTAGLSGDLSISNPGYASVNTVNFNGQVALQNGTVLSHIGLPKLSISPGGTGRVPFNLTIGLQSGKAGSLLLFDENTLKLLFALNVSYAYIFTAKVLATGSFSWGAPFANLTFSSPNAPVPGPNGSAQLTVETSFDNHARFQVAGTFEVEVRTSSGASCGNATLAVNAPGGQDFHFVGNTTVSGSSSCLDAASTVLMVYVATTHISISFPPEPLG